MAGDGGQQGEAVLTDLRVFPLGKGDGFSALGRNLLVQHRPARFALGGLNQPADLLSLLHVADQIQGGVVHLIVLVHLQDTLDHPGEVIHNIAVFPVKGRLAFGNQEQGKIPPVIPGQPVHQLGVHTIGDALGNHGLIDQLTGELRALAHRGKHDHPGKELVCGEEKEGLGLQNRWPLLGLLLFFLDLILASGLLHSGKARTL